jgi:hypothetical protein
MAKKPARRPRTQPARTARKPARTAAARKGRTTGRKSAKGARAQARSGKSSRGSKPRKAASRKQAPKARKATAAKGRTTTAARGRKAAAARGRTTSAARRSTRQAASRHQRDDQQQARTAPGLDRSRRQLREIENGVPTPPSSLDPDRGFASAARTGRQEMQEARREHTETSPVLTGGDVDADWEDAYAVGDEAPGGDNPTPDQDRVDDIGKALGVTYEDNEELKGADKIAERDKHRWELDPASSDDYRDRE